MRYGRAMLYVDVFFALLMAPAFAADAIAIRPRRQQREARCH